MMNSLSFGQRYFSYTTCGNTSVRRYFRLGVCRIADKSHKTSGGLVPRQDPSGGPPERPI